MSCNFEQNLAPLDIPKVCCGGPTAKNILFHDYGSVYDFFILCHDYVGAAYMLDGDSTQRFYGVVDCAF